MRTSKAQAYAKRLFGDGPTRRFTDEENREHFRLTLVDRGLSPDIIDRVVRLNPVLVEGMHLRGLYQRRFFDPHIWDGYVGKGEFLRRFGRAAFEALDPRAILKRGRRVYIRYASVPKGAS